MKKMMRKMKRTRMMSTMRQSLKNDHFVVVVVVVFVAVVAVVVEKEDFVAAVVAVVTVVAVVAVDYDYRDCPPCLSFD